MYPDCTHLSDFQCQPLPPRPHRSTFSVVYIFIGAWSICSGLQGRMSFSNCMRARSHQLRSDKSDPNLFSLTASWPVLWATESQDQLSWEYKYEHGFRQLWTMSIHMGFDAKLGCRHQLRPLLYQNHWNGLRWLCTSLMWAWHPEARSPRISPRHRAVAQTACVYIDLRLHHSLGHQHGF